MIILAATAGVLTGFLLCLLYLTHKTKVTNTPHTKKTSIFTTKPNAYVVKRTEEDIWREEQEQKNPLPKNVQ